MNQRLGLEEEVRQGAGREGRGKESRWRPEWEAEAARIPLQALEARAQRREEEPSSQPQIFLLAADFSLAVIGAPQPDLKGSEAPRPEWTVPSSWPR